jgi:hypothetical protein
MAEKNILRVAAARQPDSVIFWIYGLFCTIEGKQVRKMFVFLLRLRPRTRWNNSLTIQQKRARLLPGP